MNKKISAAELKKMQAAGAKMEVLDRKKHPVALEAKQDGAIFAKALEAQGVALTASMRELVTNLKTDRTPMAEHPTEWTFTIVRDSDGLLASVHAVAGNPKRKLQ